MRQFVDALALCADRNGLKQHLGTAEALGADGNVRNAVARIDREYSSAETAVTARPERRRTSRAL